MSEKVTTAPTPLVRRIDYTPPPYAVKQTELEFDLGTQDTRVTARLTIKRNVLVGSEPVSDNALLPDAPEPTSEHSTPVAADELHLDGKNLTLCAIAIDGQPLPAERYRHDNHKLTLLSAPTEFVLETTVRLDPSANTALEGLYLSNGMLCTQCEANGFQRITFYPDRPDVLSRFRVRLVAPAQQFAQLLSNGNLLGQGVLDDGRHFADWEDPFPKPCYLFALIAGNLQCHEDTFTTVSGRNVTLRIFHEPDAIGQTGHAMASIQKAMRWDEEVFGLEYDLDLFMIVAVHDFNMGAMENKGLNVFNAKYILACPETATDLDYANIEGIIAHEYFHNWTGNRVTCRDWFQLSLKEGLTVFRDQEFSCDMGMRSVNRIQDVRILRANQFKEDSGPNAHPVRPESYLEMNNLYTATVYEKGAEIVRMYHTLLGHDGFMAGMRRYFAQFDGQAATCDDFRLAMAEANGIDLTQFERWYEQAGTPRIDVTDHYDPQTQCYRLTLRQSCPATPGQPEKQPFHIPFALGLVLPDGQNLQIGRHPMDGTPQTTRVVELREACTELTFPYVPQRPIPSLLRDFSAPVRCDYDYSDDALSVLMQYDDNDFARFEAVRRLMIRDLARRIHAPAVHLSGASEGVSRDGSSEASEGVSRDGSSGVEVAAVGSAESAEALVEADSILLRGLETLLERAAGKEAWTALALELPSEMELLEHFLPAPVERIVAAREDLRRELAAGLEDQLWNVYQTGRPAPPYRYEAGAAGERALRNLCLGYLVCLERDIYRNACFQQFQHADNMTDVQAALTQLVHLDDPVREKALQAFYDRWQNNPLVIDKWFMLQAQSRHPGTLENVQRLLTHPAFSWTNPNRVRSLIGSFAVGNPSAFHHASGAGYRWLSQVVERLDPINPQTAARLVAPLIDWRKFDSARQERMRSELQRLKVLPNLSANTFELVSKGLAL